MKSEKQLRDEILAKSCHYCNGCGDLKKVKVLCCETAGNVIRKLPVCKDCRKLHKFLKGGCDK